MGMRVDKAGADNQVRRVDYARGETIDVIDLDDAAAGRGDVAAPSRRSAAIDDSTVLDQQIVRHRGPSLLMLRLRAASLQSQGAMRLEKPGARRHYTPDMVLLREI